MPMTSRRLAPLLLSALLATLAGCSLFRSAPAPAPAVAPEHDAVAAIRAAGAHDDSVIDVKPLRDPAVDALMVQAEQDERSGNYTAAAATLDKALQISPDAPDLLQERAEIAIRLKNFVRAEKLAHKSWTLGPRLGPLCARNWQTIVETRLQANDTVGASTARKWVQQCRKAGVPRY
ncbi:tetratricopeptide repeat protein [Rhodanobacter sp. FW102-FHT14D06]|uniref:Tetratricopeptide repeat protein n=2 Tax=unclassified Rhodanobacter TaxID=2621553 RepID=A0AB74UWB0_9GAMM